ncbi:MAG: hypothetical protein MJ057_07660 [Sphaerochaetaceae bacterium]|nr:hypothetical protein [Sphaerochaetaceae bacterium]
MNRFSKTVYLTILVFAMVFALVGCKTAAVTEEPVAVVEVAEPAPAVVEQPAAPAAEPVVEAPAAEPVVEAPVVEAVAEPELQPVTLKYTLLGSDITVVAGVGEATITYPAFITEADIAGLANAAVAQYGAVVADVTYAAKDGVLTVTYPETWTLADLAVAEQAVMAYVAEVTAPAAVEEPVAEEPVVEVVEEPATGALVMNLAYAGYEATVECYDGIAFITYPEFVTNQEMVDAATAAYAAYAQYLQGTVLTLVEPGYATLTYPQGLTVADFDFASEILQKEVAYYLTAMFAPVAEPVVEEPAVEEPAPVVYTAEVDVFGYKATLTYTEKEVTVDYPAFITNAEVAEAAKAAYAAFGKYLQGTSLVIDNGTAVLSFPVEITEDDFTVAVALLNQELPAYAMAVVTAAQAPVVEEPVVEAVVAVEPVVEAPAAEPVVEAPAAPAPAPEAPAAAPAAPAPAPAASTTTSTPAPAAPAPAPAPAPAAKKSNAGLIVVIIVLVLAAAAAACIVLKKKKK